MKFAVELINGGGSLLRQRHRLLLGFEYVDDHADSQHAIDQMSKQWRYNNVVAFFGPENSCDVEGRLAAAWNLPIFAYVSRV